jgi:hypothetical protein
MQGRCISNGLTQCGDQFVMSTGQLISDEESGLAEGHGTEAVETTALG